MVYLGSDYYMRHVIRWNNVQMVYEQEVKQILPVLLPDPTTRKFIVAMHDVKCVEDLINVFDNVEWRYERRQSNHGSNYEFMMELMNSKEGIDRLFKKNYGLKKNDKKRILSFLIWFFVKLLKHLKDGIEFSLTDYNTAICMDIIYDVHHEFSRGCNTLIQMFYYVSDMFHFGVRELAM